MIRTKTYERGESTVTISVDVHVGHVDMGRGAFDPVSTISYRIDDEPEQTIENVRDRDLDRRLVEVEKILNARIDGSGVAAQLTARGYE